MKKALIIGGGFAGCAFSHLLNLKDQSGKLILLRNHLFLVQVTRLDTMEVILTPLVLVTSLHKMNPYISISMNYCQSDYVLNMSL